MGLWWGLFALPMLWIVRDRGEPPSERPPVGRMVADALGEVGHTLANVRRYRMLVLFLVGFLFYNDGVQTVISQASTFAIKELEFTTERTDRR